MPSPPFGPDSRTGFELELLAPPGGSRADLAEALAAELGGRVEHGFKFHGGGRHHDGRRICKLSPAWRVIDAQDRRLCELVDDVTIAAQLDRSAPRDDELHRLITDDVRLASWIERRCWGSSRDATSSLQALLDAFDARIGEPGKHGVKRPEQRAVLDPHGYILCVIARLEIDRQRVCELVTRPLGRDERLEQIGWLLRVARARDFSIPKEAALHLHLDAEPWRDTAPLCRLLHHAARARDSLHETFETNPRCRRLRPLDDDLQALVEETWQHLQARADPPPFEDFAAEIRDAGLDKFVDVNVQGVVLPFPRQPTLELRFLPMSFDLDRIEAQLEQLENLLGDLWLGAIAG